MNHQKWYGIVFDENKEGSCEECGSKEFKMASHFDFDKEYQTNWTCSKCGNAISMVAKRTGTDKKLWEEEA